MRSRFIIALTALCAMAACGSSPLEQSLYGAGGGFLGATLLDVNPAAGAAIGAVGTVAFCQTYPERC